MEDLTYHLRAVEVIAIFKDYFLIRLLDLFLVVVFC